jgi:hypothetical protein
MTSFIITNLLPFWILGVPLVIALASWARMPRQSQLAPVDRRGRDRDYGSNDPQRPAV